MEPLLLEVLCEELEEEELSDSIAEEDDSDELDSTELDEDDSAGDSLSLEIEDEGEEGTGVAQEKSAKANKLNAVGKRDLLMVLFLICL